MDSGIFFDRVAKISIGTPGGNGPLNIGLVIQSPLRITFELTKTSFSMANEGTITVNNLSEQTRNAVRDGMFLVLEAGYVQNGGAQTIFHGEIVDVSHNIKKPEVVTTITVQDGHTALKKSRISVSYRSGTQVAQIIQDAVKALGLPVNSTYLYVKLPVQTIRGPVAYTGNVANLLDQICGDYGLQWSVQNGLFKISSLTQTDNLPPLKSVLIGSPKRLFLNQLAVSLNDFSGYEFDCLLAPKAEPYNGVTIQSNEIPKPVTLMIAEVKHSGDTHGPEWKTTVKAKDL